MAWRSSLSGPRLPARRLSDEQKLRFLKVADPRKHAAIKLWLDRAYAEALQPYLVNGKRDEVS
jgi:hypothetical protein